MPQVEETMKWSSPYFLYEGMLCGMASFKHCTFGFWKGSLIVDESGRSVEKAMGQFGRITQLSDLPSKRVLASYVKKAMTLNEQGVPSPTRSKPREKKALSVPAYLMSALKKNQKALALPPVIKATLPSKRRMAY